jgi:hypothetical protein
VRDAEEGEDTLRSSESLRFLRSKASHSLLSRPRSNVALWGMQIKSIKLCIEVSGRSWYRLLSHISSLG